MGQPAYAVPADWVPSPYTEGDPPDNCEKLLIRASVQVDKMCRNAVYVVTDDDMPEDPDLVEAFRDATLAQAQYWEETGDRSGAATGQSSLSIGSVSMGGTKAPATNAGEKDADRDAPEAFNILRNAGLISGTIRRY